LLLTATKFDQKHIFILLPQDKIMYSLRNKLNALSMYRERDRAEIYGAIIRSKNNRYALVQGRRSGKWSFPKGHANPGESPFDCVVREIGEEIGVDRLPMPTTSLSLQVGYYYVFDVKEEFIMNPRDTDEIMNVGWFTKEEMLALQVNVDLSKFISK
jgi:8-oxo-dGTP pyrophosphatase MutT (NUDIX family)